MIIRVTKKHIKKGKPGDASGCPLALAFNEAGFYVLISCFITDCNGLPGSTTPHTKKSKAFMVAFDSGRPVKPTTFRFRRFA